MCARYQVCACTRRYMYNVVHSKNIVWRVGNNATSSPRVVSTVNANKNMHRQEIKGKKQKIESIPKRKTPQKRSSIKAASRRTTRALGGHRRERSLKGGSQVAHKMQTGGMYCGLVVQSLQTILCWASNIERIRDVLGVEWF